MRTPRMTLGAAAVALAGIVSGCGGGSSSPPTTLPPDTVVIKNSAFNPDTLKLKVGDKVTWLWEDGSIPHNVDGKSDLAGLYSGAPKTSGSYSYTFTTAGTFHVTCDVHPSMHLTITVS